ncbi:hypothetical protein, partial [Halorussus sp. GCM10023401]
MSVAALLASVAQGAPCQRVRTYYLTDGAAAPHLRDFATAMERTAGALCVRTQSAPAGERVVRYASDGDRGRDRSPTGGDWECATRENVSEEWSVESTSRERVLAWLEAGVRSDGNVPDLLAYDDIRGAFEGGSDAPGRTAPCGDRDSVGDASDATDAPTLTDGGVR